MKVYVRFTLEYTVESHFADALADTCASLLHAVEGVEEAGRVSDVAYVECLGVDVKEFSEEEWKQSGQADAAAWSGTATKGD
jgi:hypothetical protein